MKIIEKYSKDNEDCNPRRGLPLGFENIVLMFLIVSGGTIFSLFLFGMEWFFKRNLKGNDDSENLHSQALVKNIISVLF